MAATEKTEAAVRPPLASAGAPPASPPAGPRRLLAAKEAWIAALSAAAILLHLLLRFAFHTTPAGYDWPLFIALAAGAVPQLFDLGRRLWRREFGSDLLAGLSILTAFLVGEYLVAVIVVLMLSGGSALERFASERATSVLQALARRAPSVAHRRQDAALVSVTLDEIRIGDTLVVLPHEICPVDGVVTEGHGSMDEAYLTGEPFLMAKAPGSTVISGAVNGDFALTVRATSLPTESRYAKIVAVLQLSGEARPRLRRIGDQLGAWYTPLALAIALAAASAGGGAQRFLAVIVVATPCPLLIAIPVAIIGAISLAARRGIVIRRPAALERIDACTTLIFDKTGTLTYGTPTLTEIHCAPGFQPAQVLAPAASLERYSKHPLAAAILRAAAQANLALPAVEDVSEKPGEGLRGNVAGHVVQITGREKAVVPVQQLPPQIGGLECVVLVDGRYAATFRFRDTPRRESRSFIGHLGPRHRVNRLVLLSGDRESEVRYLADSVGIREIYANQSPEDKVAIVRDAARRALTLFVGDGMNDAPALLAATVGVALGTASDVSAETADAVVMEASLEKVDELIHIARRLRRILLESALGGMGLSLAGMIFAAFGLLPPIAGAVAQEVIDLVAVLNAARTAAAPRDLTDFPRQD
ncbi:MAG TPA: heavy metal translocating P-type ATPase [Terriglobales bacterium]|nr:heavy metal translocating P-type ATPase [Terriglobales bacterium]